MDKKKVGIVKVSPVPEPMTSLLSGLGLVGFAGMRRVTDCLPKYVLRKHDRFHSEKFINIQRATE